jgi:hypothetical protein
MLLLTTGLRDFLFQQLGFLVSIIKQYIRLSLHKVFKTRVLKYDDVCRRMLMYADVCRRSYRPYLDKVFQAVHEFWEQVSLVSVLM